MSGFMLSCAISAMRLRRAVINDRKAIADTLIESGIYNLVMPKVIAAPSVIQAAGHPPKRIEEYAGRVNSGHANVSVARMQSPSGWKEPGQRPDFEEITVVLRGMVRVEHENGVIDVRSEERRVGKESRARWAPHSAGR